MTFRRNGSSLQIEGIDFPGGRFVAQENGTGGITLVPHYHITDHLGSVRAVVDGSTGQVVETNDYYPFGKRWDSSSSVTSPDNRFRFNGKEDQSEFGTPYSDYGARQYSSFNGRWLTVDPLAEKYYSSSPYAFCGNNPVNLVDLDGRDWYSYIERSEDESQNDYVTKYAWTDATSQEELDAIGGKGTYLGQAVIIFDGAIDERLDENGKLTGEGAKPATITIYGINGADDIASYLGLSVSSDPSKYSMIQDGEYRLFHQQMATSVYGKESLTYRISDINGNLKINPVGGVNKYNGSTYMEGIFLHRTDKDGTARKSSQGCLVVDGRSWRDVEKQLGKSSNIYLKLSRQ